MSPQHPKSVRRRLLTLLYERYFEQPLDMLSPEDLLEDGSLTREDLLANVHYLNDRGLIELMIGYNPPMFAAARITAKGIDLVENHYEFNLLFPVEPGEQEEDMAELPLLVERLVEEADYAPVDGEARRSLLRDVQYLRDEVARPVSRWRPEVINTVIRWISEQVNDTGQELPSLVKIKAYLLERLG